MLKGKEWSREELDVGGVPSIGGSVEKFSKEVIRQDEWGPVENADPTPQR